jgi:hypothetical protein
MAQTRSKRQATSKAEDSEDRRKVSKTGKNDTDAAKVSHNGQDDVKKGILDRLMSDELLHMAYPSVDPGKGEKDMDVPDAQRPKPLPKDKAGQMDPDGKRTGRSNANDLSTGKPRGFTSDDLTPFEHLICAAMLSKPLSHRLQLRSIATLFSPPFGLNTAEAINKAGYEGCREALYEARTQHKDKTAEQLTNIAKGVYAMCGEKEEDANQLKAVQQSLGKGSRKEVAEAVSKKLTDAINGFGKGGAAIFLRRIQAASGWQSVYPFLDHRAAEAAKKLGLVDQKLEDPLEVAQHLAEKAFGRGDGPDKRRKFVRLVDVIVGLDLEKQIDAVVGTKAE